MTNRSKRNPAGSGRRPATPPRSGGAGGGGGKGRDAVEVEATEVELDDAVDVDVDEVEEAPAPAPAAKPVVDPRSGRRSGGGARKAPAAPVAVPSDHGIFWKLYHGETTIDFIGKRWRGFTLSLVLIFIGIVSLGIRGLNLGIDFRGGTSWELDSHGVGVGRTRDAIRPLGLADATIQVLGSGTGQRLRVESGLSSNDQGKIESVSQALAKVTGDQLTDVTVNSVGPTWGQEITKKAIRAIVVFFIVVALYITFRFEKWMAVAALVEVIHDVLITVGIYALVGFQVTPDTVVAFLTILGYSLYDTIVVFDKIEENTKGMGGSGRYTYTDVVNLSMNQTLMRSMNTTIVAVLPVMSVLFIGAYGLGAVTLEDFGLALLIGLISGAYSSLFVGSPLLAMVKERESRWKGIRMRLEAKGGGGSFLLSPAAAAAGGVTQTTDKRGSKVVARAGGGGGRGRSVAVAEEDDFDEEEAAGPGEERVLVPGRPGSRTTGATRSTPPRSGGGSSQPARPQPAAQNRPNTQPRSGGKANPPRPRKKGKKR